MPSTSDCWGIEVGANAIKAIRLRRSGESLSVDDFEVIPFKKVLTSPDVDAEEAIRVGLDQFLSRHDLSKSSVVVSVPGHMAFARFAKLPPVEPKKIPDIVRFEAVQQIPFPIEQVEWDYQIFQDADSPDVEVGIFAITKERLFPWLQNFQAVNMPVQGIVLTPVAVFNALVYDRDLANDDKGTILMDIGTSATDLIITEKGRVWLRTIPIGGNHFTEALVRSFKLSFSKADKLKREATTSKYSRQIFNAMRPVYVDLVQEVQKSLGYYQSLNRDADLGRLIGLGSTFRLPGLPTFLKQQLQMDVSRLDEFRKIEVDDRAAAKFAENVLSLAPAYGLALQGLNMETVDCNLLPAPVIKQQLWKSKQPKFIAAAAVAVVAAGIAFGSVKMTETDFHSPDNQQKRHQANAIIAKAQAATNDWNQVDRSSEQDPRSRIMNLNSALEYRDVWPSLLRDIDNALLALNPQPVLFSRDEESIKAIPRNQRRVMFIDSIEAVYSYTPPMQEGMPTATVAPTVDPQTGSWSGTLPQYRVTITGTTPFEPAENLIERDFSNYLKSLGDRPGVPYRIVPESVRVRSIARVGTDTQTNPGGTGMPTPPTGLPGAFPGGLPGGLPGGGFQDTPSDGFSDFQGTGTGTAGPTDYFKAALPKPLLADETRVGDTRFTFEFRVQLRSSAATAQQAATSDAPSTPETPLEGDQVHMTRPTTTEEIDS